MLRVAWARERPEAGGAYRAPPGATCGGSAAANPRPYGTERQQILRGACPEWERRGSKRTKQILHFAQDDSMERRAQEDTR